MTPLAVVGAGGFAREVLDVVDAINAVEPTFEVVGVYADGHADEAELERRGVVFRGSVAELVASPLPYVIGIGNGQVRQRIDQELQASGVPCPVLKHPSATVGHEVALGDGTVVCSHVSITSNIRVGRHVHLNLNSTVGHDCVIGDYVTVAPLVAISGNVRLGDFVTVGTSAAIIEQVVVQEGSTIGAGAVVVRDVVAGSTVVGVPAKPIATTP